MHASVRYSHFVRALLLLGLALTNGLVLAQTGVYRWVEPDGTVIFTDQPRPGAEQLNIEPTQTVPPPEAILPGQPKAAEDKGAEAEYKQFVIVSPADD